MENLSFDIFLSISSYSKENILFIVIDTSEKFEKGIIIIFPNINNSPHSPPTFPNIYYNFGYFLKLVCIELSNLIIKLKKVLPFLELVNS